MKKIGKYLVLILGIILLIMGVSLYFTNTKEDILEKLDINSSLVQELYQYVDHKEDNSALSVSLITTDFIDRKNMSDDFKFMLALKNIKEEEIKIDQSKCQVIISKENIDQSMKKILNHSDYDDTKEYNGYLPNPSSCGSLATFKYDTESKNYIGNISSIGGLDANKSLFQTKLYEAYRNKKENTIQIKEKTLYLKEDCKDEVCDYTIYKDYNYEKEIGKESVNLNEEYNFFDKYLDKAAIVTYTFKLDKNQYYFFSSKVDK